MKKFYSTLLLSLLIFSCSNEQLGTAIVKDNDEYSINAKELLKSYVNNNFDLWDELFSVDCEVRFNNIVLDKKTTMEGLKQDHTLFESIKVSDDYSHTNYFKNGEIWTNHWFTLTYTGNHTKETTIARGHTDFKWENGKAVIFQVYYDPTFQIKEAAAMSEMSK